jgi:hypothetical protein
MLLVKKLLAIIVLSLLWIWNAHADDVKDFQIEGISIGESLLKYYSETDIKKSPKAKQYKDKEYVTAFFNVNSELYDAISVSFKRRDKQYIIEGVGGQKNYNKIDECYEKQNEIFNELKILFKNTEKSENNLKKRQGYTDSTSNQSYMKFKDGSFSGIQCFKYGKKDKKKYNHSDKMRISLFTQEYNYWLVNIAFK